ncbi:hypothetical protein [Spirosoma arcticum]
MKAIEIRFFSPQENNAPTQKKGKGAKLKAIILTGYISGSGKLVFPAKTVAGLGLDGGNTRFKVGIEEGKRKAKTLYLVPAVDGQGDSFQLEKAAKSYTLSLPFILKKSGVDFSAHKYVFRIELIEYEGSQAYALQLSQDGVTPKAAYSGKPRGRKPKAS